MPPPKPKPRASVAGKLLVALVKLIWAAFVIATPVAGAWLASSLAAYANGPIWLAALAGLILFPLLPLAWDLHAERRRARRKDARPRVLTLWDRLILRTLLVNLAFLAALLATHPQRGFTALSTRGDWMLDGRQGPAAAAARKQLFRAADRLEWLYLAVRENPFADPDGDRPQPAPEPQASGSARAQPAPEPQASGSAQPQPAPEPQASGSAQPQPAPEPQGSDRPAPSPAPAPPPAARAWPFPAQLHPAIERMPPEAEQSIESVAAYVRSVEPDQVQRIKAVHDYVADRIAYDGVAYTTRRFPPQTAEVVFQTRTGVCAGYAALFVAIGRAIGADVQYVVGQSRTQGMRNDGSSHAWNAVTIEGRRYLVDTTWDSGSLDGATFKKGYRTEYFLTPPEVFGLDHFPDDPRLQLRDAPISRGDFLRQPMLRPSFYAHGLELLSPTRSQITVQGEIAIELSNPRGRFALADFAEQAAAATGGGERPRCEVTNGPTARLRCRFPAPGSYAVRLFSGPEQYGSYEYVGQIEVNSGS